MASWIASVAALSYAGLAQQVAKTGCTDAASRDNAIKGADMTAATALGGAYDLTLENQAFEHRLRCGTAGSVQLRGVEIGEADFTPLIGIRRSPDTEAVAVPHVSDESRKLDAGPRRERAFARICVGGRGVAERRGRGGQHEKPTAHAAFFKAPVPFFFASIARTNLSHFAMPARFSGM